MFSTTTRPLNSEERSRLDLGLSRSAVVRSIVSCVAAGPVLAFIVALGLRTLGPTPPSRGLMAEWLAWAPWLTAYLLVLAAVLLGVAEVQSRRRRARLGRLVVTETRVEGDLAAVVWGLCEGELDVVVIRTDASHAWVGEAFDVGLYPESTSIPAWVVIRELDGDRLFGGAQSEDHIPLITVEVVQEETAEFEALLRRCVEIERLPTSVRKVLV